MIKTMVEKIHAIGANVVMVADLNDGDKKNHQQYLQTEAEQKLTRQVLKMAQQESKKEVARAKKEAVDSNKKKN